MKNKLSAAQVVNDYNRRGINPDHISKVAQGTLLKWLVCNDFVCELLINCDDYQGQKTPGQISVLGGGYINTYTDQEIADDMEGNAIK